MTHAAVSVVIPVYNAGAYLREAVLSVLGQQPLPAQALPGFEVLVVDDHSTDALTPRILDEIGAWPQVTVLRNHRAKGAAGARNAGIDVARGDWIAFLDADDIWFPHALAQRWLVRQRQPQAQWIAGGIRLWRPGQDGFAPLAQLQAESGLDDVKAQHLAAAAQRLVRPVQALARECIVIPTTTLIRRRLLERKGLFDERLRRAEDYHLWLRCALDTDLWLVPGQLAHYRIHPASLTHGDAPRFLHEDSMLNLLMRSPGWQPHRPLLLQRLDMVMQDHCYFYRGRRRYASALRCAARWLVQRPLKLSAWKELLASGMRMG